MKKSLPLLLTVLLSACFNSANDLYVPDRESSTSGEQQKPPVNDEIVPGPEVMVQIDKVKASRDLQLSWSDELSTYWTNLTICLKSNTAANGCSIVKSVLANLKGTTLGIGSEEGEVTFKQMLAGDVFVQFSNDSGISKSFPLSATVQDINDFAQYIKASNSDADDYFGENVAISGDGKTIAIGAAWESSPIGNSALNTLDDSGAVYIYTDTAEGWKETDVLKFSHAERWDYFGARVALSEDGNRLAVTMPFDNSDQVGVANPATTGASPINGSGAVVVFDRANAAADFTQTAFLKPAAENTAIDLNMGDTGFAISGDGNTIAVGATLTRLVEVYQYSGSSWAHVDTLRDDKAAKGDTYADDIEISYDGTMIAIGSPFNDSKDPSDPNANNSSMDSGFVYVYKKAGAKYALDAYVKPTNFMAFQLFGAALEFSRDGNTLVASAPGGTNSAKTYFFEYNPEATTLTTKWVEKYALSSPTDIPMIAGWGARIALSIDGTTLAISATQTPTMPGINGDVGGFPVMLGGAVFIYDVSDTAITLKYTVQGNTTYAGQFFGNSLGLSANGQVLVSGIPGDKSASKGLENADELDETQADTGAAKIYHF